jgi:hypothetical protein
MMWAVLARIVQEETTITIDIYAYAPDESDRERSAVEYALFCENLPLLLEHRQDVLACSEYFSCPLAFAWCSFLWIAGSGPLCLGYLLVGWQQGVLAEACPECGDTIYVSSFGGSPFAGWGWWLGFCVSCRTSRNERSARGQHTLKERMDFVLGMRHQLPAAISYWEEYDGYTFSWGGTGLQPARKNRLVSKPVVEAVSLKVLIGEFRNGRIRRGKPPNVSVLTDGGYHLELRLKNGGRLTYPASW